MSSAPKVLLDTGCFIRWMYEAVQTPSDAIILDDRGRIVCVAFVSVAEAWLTGLERGYGALEMADLRFATERFHVLAVDSELPLGWARAAAAADDARYGLSTGTDHDFWAAATAIELQIPLMAYDYDGIC